MNESAGLLVTYGVSALVLTAVLFGAAPKLVVHLLVLIYPRDHPRRAELLAEIEVVHYRDRLVWVAGQAVTALFDGIPVRVRGIIARRRLHRIPAALRNDEFASLLYVQLMESLRTASQSRPVERSAVEAMFLDTGSAYYDLELKVHGKRSRMSLRCTTEPSSNVIRTIEFKGSSGNFYRFTRKDVGFECGEE